MKRNVCVTLGLCALLLRASAGQAVHLENVDPALIARGKALFEAKCANCHGMKGDGRGPASHYLSPKPRDLTSGIFKLRSSLDDAAPTDDDLFRTLSHGMPGTSMPSWAHLSAGSRQALVAYIKTLSDRFHEEPAEETLVIPPEPPMNAASIVMGRRIYGKLQCAQCHGTTGRGDGPNSAKTNDAWGNPITPRDFTKGPTEMRSGGTASDLYRVVMLGLEGTPMPAWEPLLTEQDCWDLVHYILSLREPRAATEPVHYAPVEIPTLPSDIERGRAYFKTFGCLACHGQGGQGGVPNPNAASGEEIPALLYVAEGYTAEELADRIRKGQPEIPRLNPDGPQPLVYMPAWGQVLTEEQVADIRAYLFNLLPEGEEADW